MNQAINCDQARKHFALLLYSELSFDEEERVETHLDGCGDCRVELERQRALHAALDSLAIEPSPSLLRESRAELAAALRTEPARAARVGWWDRFVESLSGSGFLRPVGATALVLIGFFGARLMPNVGDNLLGFNFTGANQAGIARVSDVETQADGSVRVVVDETRQKTITGNLDDQQVRSLLLEAARDPNNPGLRESSVSLLTRRAKSAEIRGVLVYLVGHDPNDGIRLKAMEGLSEFVAEPEVRSALSRALLSDANPGVRTHAIDLLIPASTRGESTGSALPNLDRTVIGTLQEVMLREQNESVRQRCSMILEAINASSEIY